MDLDSFRTLQDSGWVREQRDRLADGLVGTCPVPACDGPLEAYDVEDAALAPVGGIPVPGGVRCTRCGARSRAVSL